MKHFVRYAALATALLFVLPIGCNKDSAAKEKTPTKAPAGAADKHGEAKTTGHPAEAKTTGHPAKAHAAHATGAGPKTLKAIMGQLALDMAAIANALWIDDFPAIAKHAHAIANHSHVLEDERKRIVKTLGKDFAEFVKGDRLVHDAAVRLHEVAGNKDMKGTLENLATIQNGCVACHAKFRARLVVPK